jgi:hypothetical protein
MEGELWKVLYPLVCELGERYRQSGVQFSNRMIVLVHAWATLHDRPVCWACDPANWPQKDQPARLPSPSTMSRRMRTISVLTFLEALGSALRDRLPHHWVKMIDAKPLPVGSYSKDPDARWGRAGSAQAKGYKLFAICDGEPAVDAWRIGSMNESEVRNGIRLLDCVQGSGYLLGEAEYDANPLYAAAAARGWQLLTPRQKPQTGLGHRPQHASRLRSIELWPTPFGQALYACRTSIERCFGNLGSFGGGLGPLPAWVRRPHRVATWVQMKIIINAARAVHGQRLVA